MREFKIFAAIADIHIGNKRVKAESLKQQLKDHFFKFLKNSKYLDGIFICGDILDTILSLNSEYSNLYLWFIDHVYKIAKKKGSTVIIVKGTISHDNDQLNNIKSYINNDDGVDFRIYDTVEETTIWKNYKVLILPDVKPKQLQDIDRYLTEDKKYDIILGHGLIADMKFFIQESENMPTKTYVYDTDKLINSCKGPILFGHIHQYQTVKNHFYYIGPYTLLERGGLNSGFVVGGIVDCDKSKFKIEQYVNPDSARYYELNIGKKVMDNYPIDDIFQAIDEEIENAKDNDLITLRITRGDAIDSADKILLLESRYRDDPRISIVKKIKTKAEEETEKSNQDRKDKYSYIMDSNLSIAAIIYKYFQDEVVPTIKDKKDTSGITEEDFKRILNE